MTNHEIIVELLQARASMAYFHLGVDGIDKVLEHAGFDISRLPKQEIAQSTGNQQAANLLTSPSFLGDRDAQGKANVR